MRIKPFMLDSTRALSGAFKGLDDVCPSRMRVAFQTTENCNQLIC